MCFDSWCRRKMIMSRYFKCSVYLQRCAQINTILRCTIHTGNMYSYKNKTSSFSMLLLCRRKFLLPYHSWYFSTKVSKIDIASILRPKDEEKYSDSDSESEGESSISVHQKDVLETAIEKGTPLSSSEWETLKDEVCSSSRIINTYNVDAVIMARCGHFKTLDVGMSYIDHLSVCGKKLNIATIAHFLRLCYVCKAEGVNEQLVLSMYEDLHSRCPVFDAFTAECAILGLCLTNRWKEGLELLDMIKLSCLPGGLEYNALIATAFENDDVNTSMKLIEEVIERERRVRPVVYHAWLDYCDRVTKNDKHARWKMVEELLLYFVENDIKPSIDVVEKIRDWYLEISGPQLKTYAEFTTLAGRGMCMSCRKYLNPIIISKENFETLRSTFVDRVVIGKDVFVKTTPEEVKEFLNFVRMTAPYDVVLDGLNIAFAIPHNKSPKSLAKLLFYTVKHFVTKSQKVLVLGRKHMHKWPQQYMDYIFRNSHVFLAENISQDDPFLLYATLYSGMGTKFLSRDLMRGHAHVLKNKTLRSTFRRWQLQHQIHLRYITEAGKVHLKFPLTFNPMAQVSSDRSCWHIPYEMEFLLHPPQSYEAPATWLCLRSEKVSPDKIKDKKSKNELA